MNRDNARQITKINLIHEMNNLVNNYMQIYDEYYETGSRDSAFIKDLTDSIIGISGILEVYARDKQIFSGYALEKLNWSKSYIEAAIRYFEKRGDVNE